METLQRIVRDNAKQRFTIQPEPTGEGGAEELWIRANQGHSVVVGVDQPSSVARPDPRPLSQVESLELKEVASAEEVPVMVHGTAFALWPVICEFACLLLSPLFSLTRLLTRSEGGTQKDVPESHPLRCRSLGRQGCH